jgi:hypothetical protein
LPYFEPLHIANFDDYGTLNLPPDLYLYDPLAIFKLFFTNKIIEKLMEWINKYAELYPVEEDAKFIRRWKPIDRQELYAYFSILIYIGITVESSIKDYWDNLELASVDYIVKNSVSKS